MFDLKKLQQIVQRSSESKEYPKHVILNLFPLSSTEEKRKEDYERFLKNLHEIINLQVEQNIPILTISLGKTEDILDMGLFVEFCSSLLEKAVFHKINITIFGRWYELMGEAVEALKLVNNETNDFDNFFLNICINYDGKQEIVDACRVMMRKILSEKVNIDQINPTILKENIYTSYFLPPDFIIEPTTRFSGTFLYDTPNTKIYQLQKPVLDILKSDIQKAITWYLEK